MEQPQEPGQDRRPDRDRPQSELARQQAQGRGHDRRPDHCRPHPEPHRVGRQGRSEPPRRLRHQAREHRGQPEPGQDKARVRGRSRQRQCEQDRSGPGGQQAVSQQAVDPDPVGDQPEHHPTRPDAPPIEADHAPRGGGEDPTVLGQHREGPRAERHLQAGVEEEDGHLEQYRRMPEGRRRAHSRAVGRGGRRRLPPMRPGRQEQGGERQEHPAHGRVAEAVGAAGGEDGGHQPRAEHGPEAVTGVQPVHVPGRQVICGVPVQTGVDGPGAQPVGHRTRDEEAPHRGSGEARHSRRLQGGAGGQEQSDAEGVGQAAGEEAGHEVPEPGGQEGHPCGLLREPEGIADGRPGHAGDGVGQAEADEPDIRQGDQQRPWSRAGRRTRVGKLALRHVQFHSWAGGTYYRLWPRSSRITVCPA